MKRLQIVEYNLNIGHCKVYSTDFITNIFMVHQTSQFRILNSEFRIPHFEKNVVYRKYSTDFVTNILWFIKLPNSEFRILNS